MQLRRKEAEGRTVLFLNGYLNESAGELLEQECQELLNRGVRGLKLDFSGTSLVNSIGVSYLLDIIEEARQGSANLEFAGVPGPIRDLFELLGISSRVPLSEEA
jgi:anti-anti-sigma regulatory factor